MRLGAYVAELAAGLAGGTRPTASRSCPSATATATSSTRAYRTRFEDGRLRAARARRPTAGWSSSSSSPATRSGSAPRPTPSSRAGPTGPRPLFREFVGAALAAGRGPQPASALRRGVSSFRHLGEREIHRRLRHPGRGRDVRGARRSDLRPRRRAHAARRRGRPRAPDQPGRVVRQYRPALRHELLEIPAGMRDVDGEDPRGTAQRELAEEVGYRAGSSSCCPRSTTRPGSPTTRSTLPGLDLDPVATHSQSEEEQHMTVEHVALADALELVSTQRSPTPRRSSACCWRGRGSVIR